MQGLTEAELDILYLLQTDENSDKQIAAARKTSVNTIKHQFIIIKLKLGLDSRVSLALWARENLGPRKTRAARA